MDIILYTFTRYAILPQSSLGHTHLLLRQMLMDIPLKVPRAYRWTATALGASMWFFVSRYEAVPILGND